jgi:hypothetical protein
MKLVLQIALGVFLGTLTGQLALDAWRTHREAAAQQAAVRQLSDTEQKVRALFQQGRQGLPPPDFIPDDGGK